MRARRLFIILYAASGAAALVYEVTWTRLLTLQLGHTVAAVSTVLAAFGGLALAVAAAPRASLRVRDPRARGGGDRVALAAGAVRVGAAFGAGVRGRYGAGAVRDRPRRAEPDARRRARHGDGGDVPDRGGMVCWRDARCLVRRHPVCGQHRRRRRRRDCIRLLPDSGNRPALHDLGRRRAERRRGGRRRASRPAAGSTERRAREPAEAKRSPPRKRKLCALSGLCVQFRRRIRPPPWRAPPSPSPGSRR